jgi:hypothetical protein
MTTLLLWLLLSAKFIFFHDLSPHFLTTDKYGESTKPLVLLVRSIECQQIGVSVDGPKSFITQRMAPLDGTTLRIEYPRLLAGHYVVYIACVNNGEIVQLVDAGSADVI